MHAVGAGGGGVRAKGLALAAFWLGLAGASAFHYTQDRAGRRNVLAFAREWGFDVRKPRHVEQISLAPSADLAAEVMAGAAVEDETSSVRWNELDAAERAAWMDALARRGEMLEAAHALALSAVAANPGLAFHAYRAGQLAYLSARRRGAEALKAERAKWLTPLRRATRLAPGFDGGWTFLGAAVVETWPLLPKGEREEGRAVLKRAFLDPGFARTAFVPVSVELGVGEAVALVPEVPGPLAAAQDEVARAGNVEAAAALRARWEGAETKARAADLALLEERARMGDDDGLRAGCRAFVGAHPPGSWTGRRGDGRRRGCWSCGPRTGRGRGGPTGGASCCGTSSTGGAMGWTATAVARAAEALVGVPDTDRARLALLSGNRYGWERVVRESKTVGSLEWTTFFAELARAELAAGRTEEAAEALGRIAPPARGECAVLLARRAYAEAAGDAADAEEAGRLLAEVREAWVGPEAWSTAWSLPLCVDAESDEGADRGAELRINFAAAAPALLAWEVNGGRRGTFVVGPEGASLGVPLDGLQGVVVVSLPLLGRAAAGHRLGVAQGGDGGARHEREGGRRGGNGEVELDQPVKGDGDERAEPREGEGALLVTDAQERAAEEEEGEGDPGHDAEERADGPAGDEELEEVPVGRLDEAHELAGLDDPERLAEGAEAGAEDRVALPGFEGVRPEEDPGVGAEVARVGGEEAQERARPEGGDDEEDAEGEAGGERGPLGRPDALVAVGAGADGQAGEKERGGRRGEHAAAGVGEGEGRGEEAPEERRRGPRPRCAARPRRRGWARAGGDGP